MKSGSPSMHGLGLDAAHAPAQHAEAVDHGGVRVGADQRVRKGHRRSPSSRASTTAAQVLQVDLVDDAGVGRHDAHVVETRSVPQRRKRVALAVTLDLALRVPEDGRLEPNSSTCTEWSMTSSAGICGLIAAASPPSATIASRMAARSTIAGTPVKSCRRTRAGRKEISWLGSARASQPATARTSSSLP